MFNDQLWFLNSRFLHLESLVLQNTEVYIDPKTRDNHFMASSCVRYRFLAGWWQFYIFKDLLLFLLPKDFSNANSNANFAHICIWYITFDWYSVIWCLKVKNKLKGMKSNKINFQKIPKLKRRKWRNFDHLWFLGKVLAILIT